MPSLPNPVRLTILWVGLALARLGVVDEARVRRMVDLAWPRVVTGIARMSKNAADVAMVGVGVNSAAIAGVGFAGAYWGVAFTVGGGLAAGTIALVSQRYGAGAHDELGQAIRTSVLLVVAVLLPIGTLFWLVPAPLIDVLSSSQQQTDLGAAYLSVVALGVPFAGLNLVGSRALVGADDAWTAMVLRATGAVVNIVLNALFIFGLGWGVEGAALGTVLSNVLVTAAFVVGVVRGNLPGAGEFPVSVSPRGTYLDAPTVRDIVEIGLPVVGRNMIWTVGRFPLLAFVALFGGPVVAAYVIAERVWGLLNTPGWGFGLAASSLVGQHLGEGDEDTAERYGHEIARVSVGTYLVGSALVVAFARDVVLLFVASPTDPTVDVAVPMVQAAAIAVIAQGVNSSIAGALDATGDTNWPFYSRALGMLGLSVPLVYLGATTPLGLWGVYLSFGTTSVVPAAINYHRFSTGKWKAISRAYRPDTSAGD